MTSILDRLEAISLESKNLVTISSLVFDRVEVAIEDSHIDAVEAMWYIHKLLSEHEKKLNELPEIILNDTAFKEMRK